MSIGPALPNDAPQAKRSASFFVQVDVAHADVSAQFVFAFAMVSETFAQPSAGLAVAGAVHVADAGAGVDQPVACGTIGDANVSDPQIQILIALDAVLNDEVADLFAHVEIRILRNFDGDLEVCVAAR